jgi:hypothetical protein
MKKEILTEDDFYQSATGQTLRGGNRRMYNAELVVKIMRDGTYEVLKDRFGLSSSEVENEIGLIDNRLLLMM